MKYTYVLECTIRSSVSSSTLFSSEYVDDTPPFKITPRIFTIPSMHSHTFTVTFLPKDEAQYCVRLMSNIASLNPALKEIDISVEGEGLVPDYYFEMDKTDYFTRRPNIKQCFPEDVENPKVLELVAVGIGDTPTR